MCGTCPTAPAQSEIIHLYSFGGPRLRQLSFYKSLRRRRHRIPCVLEPLLYPPLDNQMAFKIFYIFFPIRGAPSSIFLPARGSHIFPSPPKGDAREIEEIQYLSAECFSNSPKEKKDVAVAYANKKGKQH
jgi:hypothetical protein